MIRFTSPTWYRACLWAIVPVSLGLGLLTTASAHSATLLLGLGNGEQAQVESAISEERGPLSLWHSDGTAAGTDVLSAPLSRELPPSAFDPVAVEIYGFVPMGSDLYAIQYNIGRGGSRELIRIDGASGEVQPLDVSFYAGYAGEDELSPLVVNEAGDALYFAVNGDNFGGQSGVWRSDGTAGGTRPIFESYGTLVDSLDVHGDSAYIFVERLEEEQDTFFTYLDLWRVGSVTAEAQRLQAFAEFNDSNVSTYFVPPGSSAILNDVLYFAMYNGSKSQMELWRSSGTEAGTQQVAVIDEAPAGNRKVTVFSVGEQIYFVIGDSSLTRPGELWRSDGTAAGTQRVSTIVDVDSFAMAMVDGVLYFAASDNDHGMELWRSSSEAESGVSLVKDIVSGSAGSFPESFVTVNDVLYFTASNAATGRELWRSDGTEAGTSLVFDLNPGSGFPSALDELTGGNTYLYFTAVQAETGRELWRSDGTPAGTELVIDLKAGRASSEPQELSVIGDRIFFLASSFAAQPPVHLPLILK